VRQLQGRYRVENAALKPLYAQLRALLDPLHIVRIRHVPREQNSRADELANAALDGRLADVDPLAPGRPSSP